MCTPAIATLDAAWEGESTPPQMFPGVEPIPNVAREAGERHIVKGI